MFTAQYSTLDDLVVSVADKSIGAVCKDSSVRRSVNDKGLLGGLRYWGLHLGFWKQKIK